MRTETVEIFKFDELPDDIKEKVRENYRSKNHEIFWQEEIFASLKGLIDSCNRVKLDDYQLGLGNSYIKISFDRDYDDDIAKLHGPRAMAWIENNLLSNIRIPFLPISNPKRKEYSKYGFWYRPGKIKPGPFTGYCADEDFLESLLADIKAGHSLKDCFRWIANKYQSILEAEYEHQNSDEYIDEHLICNEYEYDSEGNMY